MHVYVQLLFLEFLSRWLGGSDNVSYFVFGINGSIVVSDVLLPPFVVLGHRQSRNLLPIDRRSNRASYKHVRTMSRQAQTMTRQHNPASQQ